MEKEFFSFEFMEVFLGGVCTIAIFSYLVKENPLFRFFEHFFIGIATSWGIIIVFKESLWTKGLAPLFGLDLVVFPDGTYLEPYNNWNLLLLLPMLFGCLYYFVLSSKHNWLAQIVIGFSFGASAGAAIRGMFIELLPQLTASFKPLYVPGSWGESISNLVFMFTLISAMTYFFFTFKRKDNGLTAKVSYAGRWMLMGCFGAFFGSTVMARMALLVERLDFLINKWFPLF